MESAKGIESPKRDIQHLLLLLLLLDYWMCGCSGIYLIKWLMHWILVRDMMAKYIEKCNMQNSRKKSVYSVGGGRVMMSLICSALISTLVYIQHLLLFQAHSQPQPQKPRADTQCREVIV